MVLYHCCVSLERANEIVTLGFEADELVHVSDMPPSRDRRIGTQTHGVVYFPARSGHRRRTKREQAGRILALVDHG